MLLLLFFSLICANAFYFHALSLFISFFFIFVMHSAFNLFVFPNYMFTSLLLFFLFFIFYERAMSSPEKLHLKITIIIFIFIIKRSPLVERGTVPTANNLEIYTSVSMSYTHHVTDLTW